MKNISYLLIFMLLGLTNCTKQVTEPLVEEVVQQTDAFRSTAPAAGPARKVQLGESNSFVLSNGLKVIVVENHKLPRVSYQLTLNNDALVEGDMAGYVSFAGQMMNKGTKNRTKSQIDESIDFIGASLNTSSTGVFASSLTKHQDALLDLMTDVLYNPVFPEEEFDKIKKQTLSGLATSKSDPNAMAQNIVYKVNYGEGHPYGEVQTEETVNNITLDKCKEYYNTYFKPNNAYLVIVGDINAEDGKMKAEKYFGDWNKGDVPKPTYEMPMAPKERRVSFANKDGAQQSVIRVTYPVDMKPGNVDVIKSRVMNSILGGGIFMGRLMQNLREDKAFTYGARSSLSSDRLVGNFNASASVRNEVTDSSVVEFIYELERMSNEPVSQSDLDLAKSSLAGSFARSLESPQTIAGFALNIARYNLPADYYETYLEKLEAVSIDDVTAMAKKYIRPNNANVVVVGSKDEVAEKLLPFDADSKIDYYDAFGKLLEDAPIEVPSDMTAEDVVKKSIDAIGGEAKMMALKSVTQEMEMDMMGQAVSIVLKKKAPNKGSMKTLLGGNVMAESLFDGTKAMISQMGQKMVYTEGPEFDGIKSQMSIFPEKELLDGTYKLELKGVENIDGTNCYKISAKDKNGKETISYYSTVTNLMMRSVTSEESQGQQVTITTNFSEYKDVGEGIFMPYSMVVTGAMPFPMIMVVKSIKINEEIDDSNFVIE